MKIIPAASKANGLLIISFVLAVTIAVTGLVLHVVFRNLQIQTVREKEKIQNQTDILLQNEIPILRAEMDKHLVRYDMRDKLREQNSTLIPLPQENIIPIPLKAPVSNDISQTP